MNRLKKILALSLISSSFLYAAESSDFLIIQNPSKVTQEQKNNNKIIITKENDKSEVKRKNSKDISFINKNVNTDKNSNNLIAKLAATPQSSPNKIITIKRKLQNIQKALLEKPKPVALNKKIVYTKGQEINVKVKSGFTTLVNFVDDAGNPIKFTYLTIGNNLVKVTQFGNKLEIKPLRKYLITNLIIGIKGYDYPVTLNIEENGDELEFDNYINVVLKGTFEEKVGDENIKLKSAILQTVFKYSKVESLPNINYEVYSLKTKEPILFSKNVMKIYKVEKFGKTYYLVLINKNFIIYGNKSFGTYNSDYNIYFLNFNQNVFTIRTNPSLNAPAPMVERYRVVIKDF